MTVPHVARDATSPEPLPRVEKPATVRRLVRVDAAALAALVGRLSDEAWRREDDLKENRFPCFHHTRHVVFRFITGNRDPRRFQSHVSWRIWSRWLLPLMTPVGAAYGFAEPVYPKAILARLEAGQRIDPHVDGDGSHPLVHKVHIPAADRARGGADGRRHQRRTWKPAMPGRSTTSLLHGAFNGGTSRPYPLHL